MKILVSDLDGTLIQNNQIHQLDLRKLYDFKAQGNKVVIATGRPLSLTRFLRQAIDADYVIGCNGAYIEDAKGNCVYQQPMLASSVKHIISYYDDHMYMFGSDGVNLIAIKSKNDVILDDVVFISITLKIPDFAFLETLANELMRHDPCINCVINNTHLDIVFNNINKARGIKQLIQINQWAADSIYVVGDHLNDICMFDAFYDHSYAISSGSPLAKTHAKYEVDYLGDIINDDNYNLYK